MFMVRHCKGKYTEILRSSSPAPLHEHNLQPPSKLGRPPTAVAAATGGPSGVTGCRADHQAAAVRCSRTIFQKQKNNEKKGTVVPTLVKVKQRYKDVDDYIATYESLVFEEAKSQII
ncbi:hypothetical protein JHK85_013100 [Glycine max]|nr:hypothetical protein JHK85_013100 [Glycine max]